MYHLALLFSVLVAQSANMETLRSAMDPNPALQSYTATASLTVHLHFPPISRRFEGTASYLRPTGTVTFDNVPRAVNALRTLTTTSPTFDEASAVNTISAGSDDGAHAVYTLVPTDTTSRIRSLTFTVDERIGLITRSVWAYRAGGTLTVDETYTPFGIFHLPTEIQISARFPHYSADGSVQLTNYREIVPSPT
jgi:hypothetical protein